MSSKPAEAHPLLIHFALAMGGFAIGTTEFATMSLVPYFAPDLGIDTPTAGHVISAYALGVVVGAPLIVVLSARMARRTLLIPSFRRKTATLDGRDTNTRPFVCLGGCC